MSPAHQSAAAQLLLVVAVSVGPGVGLVPLGMPAPAAAAGSVVVAAVLGAVTFGRTRPTTSATACESCESCGRRPAGLVVRVGDELFRVCSGCAQVVDHHPVTTTGLGGAA